MIKYKVEIKILDKGLSETFTTEVEADDEFDLESQIESIIESKSEEQGYSHVGYDYKIKSQEKV